MLGDVNLACPRPTLMLFSDAKNLVGNIVRELSGGADHH
jgi:hypothetical protein